MKKGRKRYTKRSVLKTAIPTFILLILVVGIAYGIFHTEWLRPKVNEITASYISLNTNETTDVLKITNLRLLSEKQGKTKNKSTQEFQITGEKDTIYQIVLYHLGNQVDESYVHFYLENEKSDKVEGVLSNREETFDGGRVLYEGTIKDAKKWNLKMWVDKSYHKEVNNVSYEIRIKSR